MLKMISLNIYLSINEIMEAEVDELDKRILYELDLNGRATYSEIGKKLKVSKERAKYRVQKLEESGIITNYYAVVDQAKLGFSSYRIYIKLERLGKRGEIEFIDYLMKQKDIWIIASVSGNFHVAFGVWARTMWDFQEFWNKMMEQHGDIITWFQIAPIMSYTEFSRDYLIESERKIERKALTTFRRCEPMQVDEVDMKILSALCKNARTSLDEIARELGVSLMVVRYRLKKLKESGVLLGFRALIDQRKLGYDYYKVDVVFGERKRGEEFKKYMLAHPNVAYSEETIQGSDFEFDVHVRGLGELLEMMGEARRKFGKTIKQYWYYYMLKMHKTEYIPALPG
jgi:Lrp/AsnC family leucine-responsive transcriptional regulator